MSAFLGLPRCSAAGYVTWRGKWIHGPDSIDWQWLRALTFLMVIAYPWAIMATILVTGIAQLFH